MGLINQTYISVSEISNYLKKRIESDEKLQNVYLKGEVSNFKAHSRGHFYFSLKDDNSKIDAIMFSSKNALIDFTPKNGDEVEVYGQISVYPAHGKYQIYVERMKLSGTGQLFIKYEALKKELEGLGYFDASRKQRLPKTPNTIGIVTAPTGAAIRDIISTFIRRYPIASTVLAPAIVQGNNAKGSIVKAINQLEQLNVDVIIIGRGGGSIEDLWGFNEREVADAIFKCQIPIISAVGHETDFTIADFVADHRAPTPTGAAEIAVPDYNNVLAFVNDCNTRLVNSMINKINYKKKQLEALENSKGFNKPRQLLDLYQIGLDSSIDRLKSNLLKQISKKRNKLEYVKGKLLSKKPDKLLYNAKVEVNTSIDCLKSNLLKQISKKRNNLEYVKGKLLAKKPDKLLYNAKAEVNTLEQRMKTLIENKVSRSKSEFQLSLEKLEVLNPLSIMKRGYSVSFNENMKPITKALQLKENEVLNVRFQDGIVNTSINYIERSETDGK